MTRHCPPLWALFLVIGLLFDARTTTARFAEAHRSDTVSVSDWRLKDGFVLSQPVAVGHLPVTRQEAFLADSSAIVGLFEGGGELARPPELCQHDTWSAQRTRQCILRWEADILQRAKGQAARQRATLSVKRTGIRALALRDWQTCARHGECDSEEFTYLGALARAPYQAVELSYGHDSPSLILVPAAKGPLFVVHYGSEPTFLNESQTLIVNVEDMNGPTSVIVTALRPEGPVIELQCLAARTADQSFSVQFKGWVGDRAFALVLHNARSDSNGVGQSPQAMPFLFERTAEGLWQVSRPDSMNTPQVECRQSRSP